MRNASMSPDAKPLSKLASIKSAASVLAAAFALTTATFFAGCATAPPVGLTDARWSYQLADANPRSQLVPAELHKAREALDLAETSYLDSGDSHETRFLSDIAQRKSETADGLSYMAFNQAAMHTKHADLQAKKAEIANMATRELTAEIAASTSKTEVGGTTITLLESSLFQFAQTTLSTSAQAKLDDVGDTLLGYRDRDIDVDGYTDSHGSDSDNLGVSQRQADAVRDYLVQRGYDPQRINAYGRGESSPIADNSSARGRADNRRVEIVILKGAAVIGSDHDF